MGMSGSISISLCVNLKKGKTLSMEYDCNFANDGMVDDILLSKEFFENVATGKDLVEKVYGWFRSAISEHCSCGAIPTIDENFTGDKEKIEAVKKDDIVYVEISTGVECDFLNDANGRVVYNYEIKELTEKRFGNMIEKANDEIEDMFEEMGEEGLREELSEYIDAEKLEEMDFEELKENYFIYVGL